MPCPAFSPRLRHGRTGLTAVTGTSAGVVSRKYIPVDHGISLFQNNNILDPFHGFNPFCHMMALSAEQRLAG